MATTYLSRTPSTAGNRKTWTYSAWVKLSGLGTQRSILSAGNTTYYTDLRIDSSDKIIFYIDDSLSYSVTTSQVLRDVSAWYHVVVAFDTTQATAADRVKIYLNGSQITSFSSTSYPALNYDGRINSTDEHSIGRRNASNNHFFESSLTHVHFIDGLAYAPTAFGETNAASGIWTPLASPSVTYGTNGFFLEFASSGALGTDSSGNSNTFTVNGSGTQTQDAPSNVFATLNPLLNSITAFENGATSLGSTSDNTMAISTFGASQGGYYAEMKLGNSPNAGTGYAIRIGIVNLTTSNLSFGGMGGYAENASPYYGVQNVSGGSTNYFKMYNNGTIPSSSDTGVSSTAGDIIMIAWKNDKLYMGKNGTWFNSGNPASETNPLWTLPSGGTWGVGVMSSLAGASDSEFNFGNGFFGTTAVASGNADGAGYGIFEYAPPTGYYSLCTKNINTYG